MKEVRFHPQAKAEMQESVRFYEARFEGLGFRFLAAVEQTSERILAYPEAGTHLQHGFRKRIVPGFPYNVIYRVWEDSIYLIAIAHQHRPPAYWLRRKDHR